MTSSYVNIFYLFKVEIYCAQ